MDRQSLQTLTDMDLILHFQNEGNKDSIGILYKRYMSLVFGLCYKYLKDQHQAEDATTEIFCLVMDKLKTNTITYFKSWLYIVSKNYLLGQIRKNKTDKFQYIEEFSDNFMENGEEDHLNNEEFQNNTDDLLKLGLENLKEAQQVCVELFYLRKKSYVEIADITGFEVKQVKSYIQNGKRNLKLFLESKGYQHGLQ